MVKKFIESRFFQITTTVAIILCSILLGIETYIPSDKPLPVFLFLDWVFAIYFFFEIVLRYIACNSFVKFYKFYEWRASNTTSKKEIHFIEEGLWNCFDTIIVLVSSVSLFAHVFEHPELLAVLRLFRVFRILRLLEVNKEMKQVEMKIISIIPTIFSFALLLGVLIYIYAIVGVFLFQHQSYENADFSNIQNASLTLFQCMTLEGWTDIMYQAAGKSQYYAPWFIKSYFISFIILTVIVSFNVFVAVLTSQVQEKISEENKKEEIELESSILDTRKVLQEELISLRAEIEKLREEIQKLKK